MAIMIQGNGGTVAEVDGTVFRALRVSIRPIDYGALGFYRISQISGTIAAALGANAELYHFRWVDATRLAALFKIVVSAGANVAATAAAILSLELAFARGWSADGTGGTAATLTGNNAKCRTSMGTTLLGTSRIPTTAALGAGTKTLDTQGMGNIAFGIGTGAITTAASLIVVPRIPLLDADGEGWHPLIFAQNEGAVVRNGPVAWPAAMTWNLGVTAIWAELAGY